MLEIVVDTLVFQQTTDEVEIGLVVLHAILAWCQPEEQMVLEVRELALTEDLASNFLRRLVLKDPAVAVAREEPEPGSQHDAIQRVRFFGTCMRELAGDAVEVARIARIELDLDGARLAEDIFRLDVVVLAEQN